MDEEDNSLYKKPEKIFSVGSIKIFFKNKNARPKIIRFTITKGHGSLLLQKLLDLQGYKELSYWLTSFAVPTGIISSVETTQLNCIEPSNLIKKLQSYQLNRAVLINSDRILES